jgi:hypothetical protein
VQSRVGVNSTQKKRVAGTAAPSKLQAGRVGGSRRRQAQKRVGEKELEPLTSAL